ncbi:hypothetical protein VR010_08810 [Actinomycetaceae bacterium L2_0104]
MELHVNDLVTRAQLGRTTEQELRRDGYIRIRRGIYLPRSCVPEDAPRWKIRHTVTKARALSASLKRYGTAPPVLTLESALAVLGMNTWTNTADVSYRIESNRGSRTSRMLPAVKVDGVAVGAVTERQLLGMAPDEKRLRACGVATASLATIALDCARFLHPLSALVAVSSVLTRLSEFDRWKPERSRALERAGRESIRAKLVPIAGWRGSRRAASVVDAADAGLQTPGEGYLWWLLRCMLPEKHLRHLVTQYPISLEGQNYFPDAALPEDKVLFEFDGFGKMQETERAFLARQRALTWAGWTPIRVDQGQLARPEFLIRHLLRELRGCGVAAHYPRGPLWKPLTDDLLAPERRF